MEVEQQHASALAPEMTDPSGSAAADAPKTHLSTDVTSVVVAAASARKIASDESGGEADAVQPAAHTTSDTSAPLPASFAAPPAASPDERDKWKDHLHSGENGERSPVGDEDSAATNGNHLKESEWIDDTDAESASSQPDDSRVSHFDFGANDLDGHAEHLSCEPTKAAPSLLTAGKKLELPLQQDGDSCDVESLISLPSPVASLASAPGVDVFATSPVRNAGNAIAHEQPSPSTDALSDQPDAEKLAPSMSELSLEANGVEEASSQEKAIASIESQVAEDKGVKGTQAAQPPHEMLADLSISSHNPEPKVSRVAGQESGPSTTAPSSPPASSTTLAPATVIDATASMTAVSGAAAVPPAASAVLTTADASPTSTVPASGSPAMEASMTESSVQVEEQAASAKTPLDANGAEGKPASTSAKTESAKVSPPKPGKAGKISLDAKAPASSKDSKAKDARSSARPATTKAKPDEAVKPKAAASTKASLTKSKTKSDDPPTATAVAATRVAPLKAKVQRAGVSSKSTERVAKVTSKSPVPAPAAASKKAPPAASSKLKLDSATLPPPAPSSTQESDGNKSIKKRLSSSELEAASNRLYADALESKKRKEVLKAGLEESFTFAPQVNSSKRRNIPDEKNRFVLLHEKAKEASKKKEELKQKRDKSECTFKPKITAKARKLSAKSPNPRYENLYKNAQEIKMKREEKKNENDQKAVEECSFKPKIKTMKSPTKSRPLYDAERLKQKKLALEQKKIEAEMSECTFKPKVVAKSTKAKGEEAGGKAGGESKLFDRLYQASQKRAENLEKLRHEREVQEKTVATFQPKITSSHGAKGGSKQPFHERLYNKDYMQKVTADREQKKLEEEQKFTYKPQISLVPEEIKSKQGSASSSPDKSIFERLYEEKDKVREKIELSEEIKMQKEMVGCTFHPHIETSPSHPKNQPGVPIWERLLSYDKNQVIEEREKQRQQLEMQECTFKPEVKPSDYFTPKKSPSGGIFDRLTGGAVSMPSSDMKRRESEKKASFVGLPKRRSVPELGAAMREQFNAASSVGDIIKSSKIVLSPETPLDSSANQPKSLPSSPQSSDLKNLSRSNGGMAAAVPSPRRKYAELGKPDDTRILSEERVGPEDVSSLANNGDDQAETQSQAILENYDSWTANLEAKMRSLS